MVPSNFDINSALMSAALPASGYPDIVGAFRFICGAGQLTNDDPIVYPGQPGKSHLHQFYGNTSANANSTYPSLRSTGDSTCTGGSTAQPLRILDARHARRQGQRRSSRPRDHLLQAAYRSDPELPIRRTPSPRQGVPLPNGLRFIFGWDPTGMNTIKTGGA